MPYDIAMFPYKVITSEKNSTAFICWALSPLFPSLKVAVTEKSVEDTTCILYLECFDLLIK